MVWFVCSQRLEVCFGFLIDTYRVFILLFGLGRGSFQGKIWAEPFERLKHSHKPKIRANKWSAVYFKTRVLLAYKRCLKRVVWEQSGEDVTLCAMHFGYGTNATNCKFEADMLEKISWEGQSSDIQNNVGKKSAHWYLVWRLYIILICSYPWTPIG